MMRFLIALSLAFMTNVLSEEVVTLTDSTFDEAIKSNKFVLAEFYASWCGHCKKLAPEYESAASALKDYDPKVVLAKIEATEEKMLAEKFGIKGFPTLKWFVDGEEMEYTGGRTSDTIVQWIKKRTGPAAETVDTVEKLETFRASAEAVTFGIFANEEEASGFLGFAQGTDVTPFGVCYGECSDLRTAVKAKEGTKLMVLQDFEDGLVEFDGDLTNKEEIFSFVHGNSMPSIVDFSQKTAPKIFGGSLKQQLLLFVDSLDSEDTLKLKEAVLPMAKAKKGEIMTVAVPVEEKRIIDFFGIAAEDVPTVRIIDLSKGAPKKFKFTGEELNAAEIQKFVEDFFAGNVQMDLKSAEPVPESEQGPVRVVVGKDFKDVVGQEGKAVLLEFYASWCGHCKKLEPEWTAVGEHFKDDENIIIAKIEATENEVAEVDVSGFPTIKWFPPGSSEPEDYDGPREKDGIIKWVEDKLKK